MCNRATTPLGLVKKSNTATEDMMGQNERERATRSSHIQQNFFKVASARKYGLFKGDLDI